MINLAIIGTSNSIMKNCYGQICKFRLGDECDIYGMGACSSCVGVINLLQEKIIDCYEFVLLDFTMNETASLNRMTMSPYLLISYWIFILNLFIDSKSTPIILILPHRNNSQLFSASYIPRALGSLFNVKIIDIEKYFILISNKLLSNDGAHFFTYYQDFIADKIIKAMKYKISINSIDIGDIRFSLFNFDQYTNLNFCIKGTSLIQKKAYILPINYDIAMPKHLFITGILYYTEKINPWLIIKNNNINIYKSLNIFDWKNLFLARSIGFSFMSGLKEVILSCADNNMDFYHESTDQGDNQKK